MMVNALICGAALGRVDEPGIDGAYLSRFVGLPRSGAVPLLRRDHADGAYRPIGDVNLVLCAEVTLHVVGIIWAPEDAPRSDELPTFDVDTTFDVLRAVYVGVGTPRWKCARFLPCANVTIPVR